MRNKN